MHEQGSVEAGPETALLSSLGEWAPELQHEDEHEHSSGFVRPRPTL